MEKICKVSLIGLNSKLGSEITTAKKMPQEME